MTAGEIIGTSNEERIRLEVMAGIASFCEQEETSCQCSFCCRAMNYYQVGMIRLRSNIRPQSQAHL